MATTVWISACKGAPVGSASTLCSVADRVQVSTTVEFLSAPVLDPSATFDYAYASAIWSLAFTTVVGLYLVSKNVGLVLALIRGR